jgi:hypothetical protein
MRESGRNPAALFFTRGIQNGEVIGIETEALLTLSTALENEFHCETVLVKDYSTNNIYLADKHPLSLADLLKIRAKR